MSGGVGQRGKAPVVPSKLRTLGLLDGRALGKSKQLTFQIFFPRPPYRGAQYRAARGKDGLYNFVGLVLGHGGATVQRIQKASGAKIEVRDSAGNLNGAHPSSHGDPSLHAWVAAASRQRLEKAVGLLLEVLQPSNTKLRPVSVVPGGSAVLEPVVPSDWLEAAEGPAAAAAAGAVVCVAAAVEQLAAAAPTGAAAAQPSKPPPAPPAANAWATNRLLKQHGERQMSPTSSLQRNPGAAPPGSTASSDSEEGEGEPELGATAPAPPSPHLPPPPPPPPPRAAPPAQPASEWQPSVPAADLPALSSSQPAKAHWPGEPATSPERPADPPGAAAQGPAAQAAAGGHSAGGAPTELAVGQQQDRQMATVWATGLHGDSLEPLPATPTASAEQTMAHDFSCTASLSGSHSLLSGTGSLSSSHSFLSGTASGLTAATSLLSGTESGGLSGSHSNSSSAALSWSLWERGSSVPTFYEQLQVVASDAFAVPFGPGPTIAAQATSPPRGPQAAPQAAAAVLSPGPLTPSALRSAPLPPSVLSPPPLSPPFGQAPLSPPFGQPPLARSPLAHSPLAHSPLAESPLSPTVLRHPPLHPAAGHLQLPFALHALVQPLPQQAALLPQQAALHHSGPFPGLGQPGLGLGFGHAPPAPPSAGMPLSPRVSFDDPPEIQQLLHAVASMATQDG